MKKVSKTTSKTVKISNLVDRSLILPLKYGVLRYGESKEVKKEDLSHPDFIYLKNKGYITEGNKKVKFAEKSGYVVLNPKKEKKTAETSKVKKIKRIGSDENSIESGDFDRDEKGIMFVDLDDPGTRENTRRNEINFNSKSKK